MSALRSFVAALALLIAAPASAEAPDALKGDVERILAAVLAGESAYARLSELTDGIGHRLAGSAALDRAVAWARAGFERDGHEAVRLQPVMVPRWIRGHASARIVAPSKSELSLLALGGSAGTPPGGLEAPVTCVKDFAELDALGAKVKGTIVLFDFALPPYGPEGTQYGRAVQYRAHGPARASRLGARAALVRSVTARSLRSPHTGSTIFEPKDRKIPAAAVSVEDAMLLTRLCARGPVRVRLELGAKTLSDARSANVIAELRGASAPEQIVLIGAHLDSWDVGQGAHDDGAGVVMVMEALRILRSLELKPKRTIRAVLYTNEENGLRGARAYAEVYGGEPHLAAIEADMGGFSPKGFYADAHEGAMDRLSAMTAMLAPIGATALEATDHPGADISALGKTGATLLGLKMDESTYFDIHHTAADTLDKVDPRELQKDVAAIAVMAYLLAQGEELPRKARP